MRPGNNQATDLDPPHHDQAEGREEHKPEKFLDRESHRSPSFSAGTPFSKIPERNPTRFSGGKLKSRDHTRNRRPAAASEPVVPLAVVAAVPERVEEAEVRTQNRREARLTPVRKPFREPGP